MPVDLRKPDERENKAQRAEQKFAAAKKCQNAKNQPCHGIGVCFPDWSGNRRTDGRWSLWCETGCELRHHAERFPFRRTLRERVRLRVRAAFGDPLLQLLRGHRAILPAIRADDSIPAHLFLFTFYGGVPHIRAHTAFGTRYKV